MTFHDTKIYQDGRLPTANIKHFVFQYVKHARLQVNRFLDMILAYLLTLIKSIIEYLFRNLFGVMTSPVGFVLLSFLVALNQRRRKERFRAIVLTNRLFYKKRRPEDLGIEVVHTSSSFLVKKSNGLYRRVTRFAESNKFILPLPSKLSSTHKMLSHQLELGSLS